MNVLAYTLQLNGRVATFTCNDGRTLTTNKWFDAITFLLEPCQYAVVPDVDKFTEAFCALLPAKANKELYENERTILENGERLFYSITRQLSIGYGYRGNQRNEVNIYGLSRYTDKDITDVKELYVLWFNTVKAFEKLGVTPIALPSPIGAYESALDRIKFCRACDLPKEAHGMIAKCDDVAWQEWRDTYKLGHWQENEITDFDLVSGYPSFIAKLPDLSKATFFESPTLPAHYSWGIMDGELEITKDVTPFCFVGKSPYTITTGQLRQIQQYQWGNFTMSHGFFVNIPKGYTMPFCDTMTRLYEARQTDNTMLTKIAKAVSVGIGGKFNSRYGDKPGRNYNPIYAKMITSACSSKVADLVWGKGLQDRVVSITVDGTLVEGQLAPMQANGMGSWRTEPPSPFLVLSQLYQWGSSKRPNGMTYKEMVDTIKANPNDSVYGDLDFRLLEYTRDFEALPKTGGELLERRYNSKARSAPPTED